MLVPLSSNLGWAVHLDYHLGRGLRPIVQCLNVLFCMQASNEQFIHRPARLMPYAQKKNQPRGSYVLKISPSSAPPGVRTLDTLIKRDLAIPNKANFPQVTCRLRPNQVDYIWKLLFLGWPTDRPTQSGGMILAVRRQKYLDNRTCVWYNIFMESAHDRVVASRVYENRLAGIHRRGGGVDDSFWNHFDFSWDIGFADVLWEFAHCVACLSRQEKQAQIKMPILSANRIGGVHKDK